MGPFLNMLTPPDTTNLPIDSYVDLDYGAATAPFRADGTFNLCVSAISPFASTPMAREGYRGGYGVRLPVKAATSHPHLSLVFADSSGDVKPGQHIVRPMVRGFAMTDVSLPPTRSR